GRPMSGKTRLAWQLMQNWPDALVVIPQSDQPPDKFETSGLSGRAVVLFFDDLHRVALTMDPLKWRRRIEDATRRPCPSPATARRGKDWNTVTGPPLPARLLESLGPAAVARTSRSEEGGADLSDSQAEELRAALSMSADDMRRQFDGTPGSLLLNL